MKAGFAETDITPPLGLERPGGYGKAYCDRIHDPLKVRAGVFDDGRERVALAGVDTCALPAHVAAAARREVRRRCGIREDHVLVAASHTHSGGPLFGFEPDAVRAAPALIRKLVLQHSTVISPEYRRSVVEKIVTAVCEADRLKTTARLSVGRGCEDRCVFNRRFRMRNGRVYTHPGKGNPGIVAPAGPVDPDVGVVGAWSAAGRLLGCVVNYACHGTTCQDGGAISADWIGHLERTLKAGFGAQAVTVFLNGACGDVTQFDNQTVGEDEFGGKWSRRVGARVGAEALKVLISSDPGSLRPVRAVATILKLPRRRPGRQRVTDARRVVERALRTGRWDTAATFAKELLILDWYAGRQPAAELELQAIQIGPAVLLANPAELFCELGLQIKRASPFPFTFVVELANGAAGYVPREEAFAPSGGGYETVLTSYSNLEPAAGTKLVKASLDLAQRLTPGQLPTCRRGARKRWLTGPWSYGILGPDNSVT